MKIKFGNYKSKIKNFVEDNNVEAEVSVNWKIVAIVSATVGSLIFFGIAFVNNVIDYQRVINEKSQILEDINKVEGDIEELKNQQEKSQSLEFVEKQAREKLKMVKDDEIVYIDISK